MPVSGAERRGVLLDGPRLRDSELGSVRERGVRGHVGLGHEPRDGHVLAVPGLR